MINYTEWSLEYNNQAQILREYIKKLKEQTAGKGATQVNDINRRVAMLYQIYLDLKHIGEHLKQLDKEL